MNDELRELYQQVILDHSRKPRNHGTIADGAVHVHGDNPSCGDEIDLFVKFDEAGKIADIKFDGQGCAISQASASMMTLKVKGRQQVDATSLARDFRVIVTGEGKVANEDALGELQLLEGVQHFPQRVKCAMLGWRALEQAIQMHNAGGSEGTASSED
ncbi:MAG: SUF system NifU family Fe-S cluster assembly protein [Verrucomicrobiaceae bacterium]|nr:SUF system NifU family Fe-S cluster assembly protein [Verrucomicrobiaceae bacterium]